MSKINITKFSESHQLEEDQRMVCGNMDVEAVQESYMDDLYDSTEEKVTQLVLTFTIEISHFSLLGWVSSSHSEEFCHWKSEGERQYDRAGAAGQAHPPPGRPRDHIQDQDGRGLHPGQSDQRV